MDGVYGSEKDIDEAWECEREGAALTLNVALEVEARLNRGRACRTELGASAAELYVADWNWRRYREASESILGFSESDVALSSEDSSEKAHEDRFEGTVGDRGGTMSRKCRSSKEKLVKGVRGGEWSAVYVSCFSLSVLRQLDRR